MSCQVITYSSVNAPKDKAWIGYAVLPDGSMWGVRFEGATEEQVIERTQAFYANEKVRQERINGKVDVNSMPERASFSSPGSARGAHLVGTVCMINHALKQRIRCKADEVPNFEAKGWVKGGPRTPFQE